MTPDPSADVPAVLTTVPLLAPLPAHARADLAAESSWIHLPAGEFLFRQGDPAGSLAIVWTGRLEVLDESGPSPRRVGALQRGSWVGELSLLTGEPRSASIRALRDSQLLSIPRDAFDRVLQREPELGLGLARSLAAQLQHTSGITPSTPRPDTIAVLPLGGPLPVGAVVEGLRAVAARHGRVAVLDETTTATGTVPAAWPALLDRVEADTDVVVLACLDPQAHPEWAAFCARSADRAVALLRGGRPPDWSVPLLHRRTDLAFVGASLLSARIDPGLRALAPRAHHHLPEGEAIDAAIARLARRVTGHAVGVVFSGGGARGLAHLGVIEELTAAGIPVDRVGGCSAGSLAAGLLARGVPPDEMIARCRTELVDHHPFADVTVPRESLIKGRRALAMLGRLLGEVRIEELSIPFFSVSADLHSGDLVVHRTGPLRDAVAASMTIPGFAPPFPDGERLHVDGGLLDNFPVDVMVDADEGPVIGVDVMRDFVGTDRTGRNAVPRIASTIARAMVLGGWQRAERNRRLADVLISPDVDAVGLFEFERIDDAVAAGREAARAALPAIAEIV